MFVNIEFVLVAVIVDDFIDIVTAAELMVLVVFLFANI